MNFITRDIKYFSELDIIVEELVDVIKVFAVHDGRDLSLECTSAHYINATISSSSCTVSWVVQPLLLRSFWFSS